MTLGKMHADERDTDVFLVRRLLAGQCPQWAHLSVEPVDSDGTDNAIYRLGDDTTVRLPRHPGAAAGVDKEHQWLARLAPHLPFAIPVPLAKGMPAEGYPWPWSVHRWLDGDPAAMLHIGDQRQLAADLAQFLAALHRLDPSDGPRPGAHNFGRGVPLALRNRPTRNAMGTLHATVDVDAVAAAWEASLHAPPWPGPPVWIHGDLSAGNLLVRQRRLSAVMDFGCTGVGDPACDLMVAWSLLSVAGRDTFRAALAVDEATWARGRGWALSVALIYIPYYERTNPPGVASARRTIDAVLADHKSGSDARSTLRPGHRP